MALTLYYHPLASFCHKVLIALYENATPFEPRLVDLGDPVSREAFLKLWPIGKFPVLHDSAHGVLVPESSIIIEYLGRHHPGPQDLAPTQGELAWQTRLEDRFYDLYVSEPMQKIVTDKLRPAGQNDAPGVAQARQALATAYALIEQKMAARSWATGQAFSMADCAAAPALFYADKVQPIAPDHPQAAAYLARLRARPSFARVLEEAQPYFKFFPG
jgi:glutathione S-transferase